MGAADDAATAQAFVAATAAANARGESFSSESFMGILRS
jgi:hypothetical protein